MAEKSILIVDDEPGFAKLLTEYFHSTGFDASYASNLEDALNLFRKKSPKVVILDFNMPIVTGEKFLPILLGLDPDVRVIVITGLVQAEVEEKFKGLRYFAFFEKGNLSLETVRDKVREAFET